MIETAKYEIAGRTFPGVMARPLSGSDGAKPAARGGILVLHGGGGLGEHELRVARRIADLGYVVFAPDLFGEELTDRARRMAVIGALVATPAMLRERMNGARARLEEEIAGGAIAATGHCFGGLAALELARSGADVRAVVSIHGGLQARAPARRGEIHARVLACTGADDPFCPAEHRAAFEAEMTAAGADWQHHVYGGAQHGFSVAGDVARPGVAYDEAGDRRSWRAMIALFDEVMPPGQA